MLHIVADRLANFIAKPEFIRFPSDFFDVTYEDDWLSSAFGKEIISSIDNIQIEDNVDRAFYEAGIHPEDLATGTKNLFLCKYFDKLNRLSMMGENCYHFLMDISDDKDVYMAATAYCLFRDSDILGRSIHFVNYDITVSNEEDFFRTMISLVAEGVFDA